MEERIKEIRSEINSLKRKISDIDFIRSVNDTVLRNILTKICELESESWELKKSIEHDDEYYS